MLWKTGAFTNKEIGSQLGLGYSAISCCISNSNEMYDKNMAFKKGDEELKSLLDQTFNG